MKKENQQQLMQQYPRLFKQSSLTKFESSMSWGITCGDGWFLIIKELCQTLETIYQGLPKEFKEEKEHNNSYAFTFSQIKQKWFTLRVYMELPTLEMTDAIQEAETKSSKICENCGDDNHVSRWDDPCRKPSDD